MDGYSGTQFAGGGFITNRCEMYRSVRGHGGCAPCRCCQTRFELCICSQEAGAAPPSTPQQAKKLSNNQTLRAVTVKQLVDVSFNFIYLCVPAPGPALRRNS
jgi:hypothetical protein